MAKTHGIRFRKSTPGIRTLSNRLKEEGKIDQNLQRELGRIRAATFTAEWPAGIEASAKDVQFTLRTYKEVFDS